MTPEEMRDRTKRYALAVIRFTRALPRDEATRTMVKQLVRCASSVGANYRAACLAKSKADMLMKLKIVEEESDESCYWLELIEESDAVPAGTIKELHSEGKQIFKIVAASVKTLKSQVNGQ